MGGLGYLDEEDTQFAGDQEIAEYVGGTLNRRFIRLPGSVDETFLMIDYSSNPSGDEYWAHQDRLGSVVATTDSTGAVIDKYRYSPYGKSGHEGLNGGGAPFNGGFPFRFTGQKLDAETGLYYYKARYYDPETGRFLQTDPIGYEDQMNMYAYVANDPVNATDPTGLCTGSRLTNDDGTCRSTGGFTTGLDGVAQGMQIDQAVGEAFVQASGETDVSTSDTRAAGRAFRASYNGSDRRMYGSRIEARAGAAGELVRLTNRDGNEWGTVTYSLGVSYGGRSRTQYGFAEPVTSGSPDYVNMSGLRIPMGAEALDRIHSHPGNLYAGPFADQYRGDVSRAGPNEFAVGAGNRNLCRIRPSGYGGCTGI